MSLWTRSLSLLSSSTRSRVKEFMENRMSVEYYFMFSSELLSLDMWRLLEKFLLEEGMSVLRWVRVFLFLSQWWFCSESSEEREKRHSRWTSGWFWKTVNRRKKGAVNNISKWIEWRTSPTVVEICRMQRKLLEQRRKDEFLRRVGPFFQLDHKYIYKRALYSHSQRERNLVLFNLLILFWRSFIPVSIFDYVQLITAKFLYTTYTCTSHFFGSISITTKHLWTISVENR